MVLELLNLAANLCCSGCFSFLVFVDARHVVTITSFLMMINKNSVGECLCFVAYPIPRYSSSILCLCTEYYLYVGSTDQVRGASLRTSSHVGPR